MVTALLVNWKRPKNIERIISQIKCQSLPVEILLWNNNPEDKTDFGVDLQINSSKNLKCGVRWIMAKYTDSEFVFSLDCDLMFKDNKFIENCVNLSKQLDASLGYEGVILNNDKIYTKSTGFRPSLKIDRNVDIIKGRFLFTKRINVLDVNFELIENDNRFGNCMTSGDDIIISSKLKNKIIPRYFFNKFVELPARSESLCRQKNHNEKRNQITLQYFS